MQVDCTAGARNFRSVARTLGGGGLFLTPPDGFEPGQELSLRFRPARHLRFIEARGRVCYIVAGEGAAVSFTEISDDDREKLLRLIHQKTKDRRSQPRAPLATQVECDRCMSLAFSRDVSLGGMFIETDDPLPVGSTITVRFNLGQNDRVVSATALVAYHAGKMGMGVTFAEIEPADRDAIHEYIRSSADLPKYQVAGAEPA